MKNHNGMRPQDVVILLKLSTMDSENLRFADIAKTLRISGSEVSESLERSLLARLVSDNKKELHRESFFEFLVYGLKYVFPVSPGPVVRGMATAHSAPPLKSVIQAPNELYVWPTVQGDTRGQSIDPLYKTVPMAAKADDELYELLALTDAIRVGRSREVSLAIEELKKRIYPR